MCWDGLYMIFTGGDSMSSPNISIERSIRGTVEISIDLRALQTWFVSRILHASDNLGYSLGFAYLILLFGEIQVREEAETANEIVLSQLWIIKRQLNRNG